MTDKESALMAERVRMGAYAWKSRIQVGCVIQTEYGTMVSGFNIEGLWMTSLHAEVVAVTRLVEVAHRGKKIFIDSKCEHFTPCGSCLDWLNQFCLPNAKVIVSRNGKIIKRYVLGKLYKHYPKK